MHRRGAARSKRDADAHSRAVDTAEVCGQIRKAASRAFSRAARERGVFKGDNKTYVPLAHDERDVGDTIATFSAAARHAAAEKAA